MGEANHTPGPWVANGHNVHTRPDESAVCVCVSMGTRNNAEASANARLIASAPELLEALEGAIGALEFSRDYHADLGNEDQAFAQSMLDAALSAIAKARGQQ